MGPSSCLSPTYGQLLLYFLSNKLQQTLFSMANQIKSIISTQQTLVGKKSTSPKHLYISMFASHCCTNSLNNKPKGILFVFFHPASLQAKETGTTAQVENRETFLCAGFCCTLDHSKNDGPMVVENPGGKSRSVRLLKTINLLSQFPL